MGNVRHGGMAMLVVLVLTPVSAARAQFSPGKLSRAHAALEGTTQCFKCHEPRKATTASRCFACHQPLATRLEAGKGLHAGLEEARQGRCGRCHAEHGGADAQLVHWPGGRDAFDHRRAGFVLDGKHGALGCNQCHKPDLVRADDVRTSLNLSLTRTYLGLARQCAACHRDPHHGQFAAEVKSGDCARCHSTQGWKPAAGFDHKRTRFPLDGKHVALGCERCHYLENDAGAKVAGGTAGAFARYKPLGLECTACHTDVHQNRYGSDCRRCHTTRGWRELGLGNFDHSKARFPLDGRHLQVACTRCHWSENAAGNRVEPSTAGARVHYRPIAFQKCTDCHRDPHQNRFGPDCARCHSPAGWRVITAGAFDHDRTKYPLRGRHRDVACEKCHGDGAAKPLVFAACSDCHADAHQGQLAARAERGACESCHRVDGFTPVLFGVKEHASTRFPLQEGHRAVPCVACHRPAAKPPAPPAGRALATAQSAAVLRFDDRRCAVCHGDPHMGQFAVDDVTDCSRCHGLAGWRIARFDHARTRFRLEGAHARTACASCHREETMAGKRIVRYRPLATACRSCHADMKLPDGTSTAAPTARTKDRKG